MLDNKSSILVTGGLGYIGSHTVLDLFSDTQFHIIILDDLSNCKLDVLDRMKQILQDQSHLKQEIDSRITFTKCNTLDLGGLDSTFESARSCGHPITTIINFAGKKCVPESVSNPILYFDNNFVGTLNLFKCMEKHHQCKHFLFSSTATVYGEKDNCTETDHTNPLHSYAESKLCVEMLMRSVGVAHPDWRLITLRYFNPCGSHPTGLIGDEPSVFPNNLFPYIIEVILGNKPKLFVYGTDYDTPDGTGIRDYLHICDLSKGHIAALKKLPQLTERNYEKYNLGTGKGLSVMDIIHGFEQVLARKLPYELAGRRPGDVTVLVANVEKAHKELQWSAQKTLADMCRDSVNYARKHGKV